jgi:dTDP-4-amino-4,6-dideoxygalactose transaminase
MVRHAHVPSPTLTVREVARALASPLEVAEAERRLEGLTGGPTVLFASARGALAAAVEALAAGGSVAVPGYTCVAVANAVDAGGATAIWTDVDGRGLVSPDSWPDADLRLVQDTYGFPAPLPRGVPMVRDAAHRADALLGDPGDATVTVTSLEHSKWVSAGQGGIACTADAELAGRLRALRDRHPARGAGRGHAGLTLIGLGAGRSAFAGRRVPTEILNRLTLALASDRAAGQSGAELAGRGIDPLLLGPPPRTAAALAVAQMSRAQAIGDRRRRTVAIYDAAAGVERAAEPLVRYPLWADDRAEVERRVRERGWELGRPWFVSPLHPREPAAGAHGYAAGMAPGGEELARHVVNLPTHTLVRERDARELIDAALAAGARPLR